MSGFVIKCRGGGLMLSDYECPVHGVFEATVERPAPAYHGCLIEIEEDGDRGPCLLLSERRITGTLGRVRVDEVVRGKSDPPPSPIALDTRALGEGMKASEFKRRRRKMWDNHDRAKWKAKLG